MQWIFLGLVISLPSFAAPLPTLKDSLAPMNAVVFCQHYAADCSVSEGTPGHSAAPRAALLAELNEVNIQVNHSFPEDIDKVGEPGMDPWLISPASGNCADYAVTKRHELLALGWPSRDLLLTDALIEDGAGHTVLLARLNGEFVVLDSLTKVIRPVSRVPYRWVKIQSDTDPNFWRAPATR